MAEKRIDIIIGARNQAAGAFAQARADVDKFNRDVSRGGKSAAEQVYQMALVVGKVRVAIDSARIVAQLFKGDWDGVAESVKKLPLGLGQVATSLQGLIESVFGLNDGLEELVASQAKQETSFQKLLTTQKQALSDVEKILDEALSDSGRREQIEAQRHAEKVKRLEEIAKLTPALAQKAAEALDAIHAAQFARDLRRQEQEALEREEQAQRLARTIEELDSEIRQKSLEAQGKTLDAELERIREHYRRRIDEAETAAERERLIRLRALDEEEAKRREIDRTAKAESPASPAAAAAVAARGGVGAVQVGGRFLGLAARFAGGQDPASDTAKSAKEMAELLKRILKLNEEAKNFRPVWAGHVVRA